MTLQTLPDHAPRVHEPIGRVVSVSGAQAVVGLTGIPGSPAQARATVGKFIAIQTATAVTIGMITEITEKPPAAARDNGYHAVAQLDLVGEIKQLPNEKPRF